MRIYKIRKNCIVMELSAKELKAHALCVKDFKREAKSPQTLFYVFLPELIKALDREIKNIQKVSFSVFENDAGRCLLLLRFQTQNPSTQHFLCKLSNPNALFLLSAALSPYQNAILESQLFLDSANQYIVYIATKRQAVRYILSEFGTIKAVRTWDIDYYAEHAKLLSHNFIQSLTP